MGGRHRFGQRALGGRCIMRDGGRDDSARTVRVGLGELLAVGGVDRRVGSSGSEEERSLGEEDGEKGKGEDDGAEEDGEPGVVQGELEERKDADREKHDERLQPKEE